MKKKQQTQVELASAVNKDTASVTRILDLLHDKKLVRRVPNESDKRKKRSCPYKQGNIKCKRRQKKWSRKFEKKVLKGITRADVEITNRVLKQMAINMA